MRLQVFIVIILLPAQLDMFQNLNLPQTIFHGFFTVVGFWLFIDGLLNFNGRTKGESKMSYHRDSEVNHALVHLMDALCTWERVTGRGSKLLLIPDEKDEEIVFAVDGKPIPHTPFLLVNQLDRIKEHILVV